MARRHVKFDMNALCKAASEAVGSKCCKNVEKCADGMYNKAFVLTMEDGAQVIAKIPNPNAGRAHFTTASEVATMDFARNELGIPAPKVFTWDSTDNNAVGAEYIIMEKAEGLPLEHIWPSLDVERRVEVVRAVARYLRTLSEKAFTKIGSLYYVKDLPDSATEIPLFVDMKSGESVKSDRFAVGPTNAREWFDHGRGALKCDRGPWTSALDYRQAMAEKEMKATREIRKLPKPSVMLYGPGLYQPTPTKKLYALDALTKVLPLILPDIAAVAHSHLWHNDLHAENIFVDAKDPTRITSIIDWQSVSVGPLLDHSIQPAFLNLDASAILEAERPEIPTSFGGVSNDERPAAIKKTHDDTLTFAVKYTFQRFIAPAFQALEYQESLPANPLILSRRTFEVGEAHATAAMARLRDDWEDLPSVKRAGNPPFPLSFSDADLAVIKQDLDMAMASQDAMDTVAETLGELFPEKGLVRHEQFHEAKKALAQVKADVLHQFAHTPKERSAWEESWPFDG